MAVQVLLPVIAATENTMPPEHLKQMKSLFRQKQTARSCMFNVEEGSQPL